MSRCWNCDSPNFEESGPSEYCPDCGIYLNYKTNTCNLKYLEAAQKYRERNSHDFDSEPWVARSPR